MTTAGDQACERVAWASSRPAADTARDMSGQARDVAIGHTLGRTGEDDACQELARRGYAILARRYRAATGEIDIVARLDATMVFVEVKARRAETCGAPEDAVTGLKRRRLWRTAMAYLTEHRCHNVNCRFDVVAIRCGEDDRRSLEVFENAFDIPDDWR